MTPRERRLAVLLSALIVLFVFGGGGYFGVYQPLSERYAQADSLEQEIADRQARLDKAERDRPRLVRTLKRSLPADQDTARQEYDAAINRVLKDARVPASAYTVKPKATDGKSAPELDPKTKKPAFSRVALEVSLSKVSYATVLDVLSRYYRLNLLQQISKFTIKKTEDLPPAPLGSSVSDRPDLTVTFVTEAIILDGAENRRSLLPIPSAAGAAGGGAGYATLFASPEITRGMTPVQWEPVLAVPSRDYAPMLVKDIFHGPPPGARPKDPPPPPDPPKEDTSRFIRLTGFGANPDGTGSAFIEDSASKQEYAIAVTREGGKLKTEVVKFYYSIKGVKKAYAPEPVLDISDSSSRTARKFKVAGFDGETLVLTEAGGSASAADSGMRVNLGGRRPPPSTPPRSTPPGAALVGGSAAATAPPAADEKVFAWKHGETLNTLKELPRADGRKLLSRLGVGPGDEGTAAAGGNSLPITVSSGDDR